MLENGLQRVQRPSGIALGMSYEQVNRVVTESNLSPLPSPLLFSGHRPFDDRSNILLRQGFEHEHAAAR